jgi:hypothetical protein
VEQTDLIATMVVRNLTMRGLARVPNRLAFAHNGEVVDIVVEHSVYTGYLIVIVDGRRKLQHFRARDGDYDWSAIAAFIVQAANNRKRVPSPSRAVLQQQNERLARDLASIVNAASGGAVGIEPSTCALGRVRVKMPEIELDAISVMRLFEVVRDALPAARRHSHEASSVV